MRKHSLPLLLALTGGTLLWTGCHRRHDPEPGPAPCATAQANPLRLRFLESFGTPTPDTAYTKQDITFEGPGAPYTRYEWQIGNDPRSFTQPKFSLYFPASFTGSFPVRLIAHRPPNLKCFPKDDGVDTLTQVLTLVSIHDRRAPVYGKFQGSNADAPRDTFTIRVFSGPNYDNPNNPAASPYDYLRNLSRGCQSPYFNIGLVWRGIRFSYGGSDFNCNTEAGAGYLSTRDSIRVDYSQFESAASLKRINRVFRGKRQR
ncbi:hypothetical protein [Hymenobacter algoricola]|uniref:PKD domain-containing protein n=1 Tax=Hymenobacter algoricola TaxID=486267 RepID=A0ABP7N1P8_9BACT